ncbi:MAG: HAD-IA family hydrolase [Akkermansiaceae bacterium]
MSYRALIFDFDGTLADTLDESVRIYNTLAIEHGLRPVNQDDVAKLRHMRMGDFLRYLEIPKRRVPKLLFQGTRILKENIGALALFEGMAECLHQLRETSEHFGILTSNSVENVEVFLRNHGLDDTFTFVSSTSKLTGKAKHLRAIRKTFSLDHAEMLYVGDEIRDIKAAQKANIASAAVGWGFNSAESLRAARPDHFCEEVADLLEIKRR